MPLTIRPAEPTDIPALLVAIDSDQTERRKLGTIRPNRFHTVPY